MATFGGQNFSDDEIKNFFATTDNAGIAAKAASLGMTADQISQAARIAGKNWSAADVTGASQGLGYDFNNTGGIVQRASAQSSPGGAQVGSNYYTGQQVKDFYASGGNDNQFAQQAGITDPWQRRETILAARQSAGGAGTAANSGEAGLQSYFQQYRKYNPNGANVNSYENWLRDQNPHTRDAMRAGTFTGSVTSPTDWGPNGIYAPGTGHDFGYDQGRYGTGAHGTGDGWNAWTGSAGENRPGANGAGGSGGSGGSGGAGGAGGSVGSGGVSGGSGAGGSSSGGLVSSAMGPTSASVQNWDVTAPQTVNQQVANVVNQDGPLMQQARARALMAANERGLVNSSMAVGDAQSAVLDRAIEIGSRDASTNAQAAQFNANAANQNAMFNSGQSNQWNTNALDRANNASERAKDRAAAIAAAGFDAQTRKELAALEQTYRTQLNSDEGFDRQFAQYTETLLRIDSDPNLDAEAKTRLKETALNSLRSYATVRNLNLDLNFGTQPTTPLTQTEIAAAAAQRLREIAAAQGLISQSGGFQGAGVGTGADGSASGGVGGLGIGDGGTGGSGD